MKKYNIASGIDRLSLDKRIKTLRFVEFCLEHTWFLILIFAANAVFTWFVMLRGQISGLFDIITLVIFPILSMIGEFGIILFASFAEICAEMVSDTLFPRYTEFPAALLANNDSVSYAEKTANPPVVPTPAAATQQVNPRYGNNSQQNTAKTPPVLKNGNEISLVERLRKRQSEPEYKLSEVIAPAVRTYADEMLNGGITVSTAELLQLWLIITRLIAIDRASIINDESKFISDSIKRIECEMPEIANDFSMASMNEEYYRIDAVINENKALANDEHDEFTKNLIWSIATFLVVWDYEDDETEDLIEEIVLQAIEEAAALF